MKDHKTMITLRPVSQSLIQTATPNNRMNSHNQSIATTPRRVNLMKFPCWLLVLAALAVAPAARAQIVRANTAGNLNTTGDWVGSVVPGSGNVAQWDATVTTAGNCTAALGGNLSWLGITILTPSAAVVISPLNTLTLGASGINMSSAGQNLTISSALTIGAVNQGWNVASGETLTLNTGTFTRTAGGTLNIVTNGGIGGVVSTMTGLSLGDASTPLQGLASIIGVWASTGTGSSTAYAITNATGNIVPYTSATLPATGLWGNIPAGGSGTVNYDLTNTTTAAFGSTRNINTARHLGGATTVGTAALTFNGIMNAGSGLLTFTSPLVVGSKNNLVFNCANADIAVTTVISGASGAITKTGPNNLILTNAVNTYAAGTYVNQGKLFVMSPGSLASGGTVTVAAGATLAGTGIINTTTTVNGSLLPGDTAGGSAVGTLAFGGALTLASATPVFQLNTNATSGNDLVSVTGNLTLDNSDTIHISALNGAANLDTNNAYLLFQVSGTTTMTTTPTVVFDGTSPANAGSFSLVKNGNNVYFTATNAFPGADIWVGSTSANFSTGPWTGANNPPISLDSLTFNADGTAGTAASHVLNDDLAAGLTFSSVTFGASAPAYTIGGNAFTLGTATGGTALTTTAGAASQTISNNITLGVAAQTTFSVAASPANLKLGGIVSGASSTSGITKTGTGALTFSGANTYSGSTVVAAGTLTNNETVGSTASTATMTVGTVASTKAVMTIGAGANFSAYNLAIGGVASGLGAVWQSGGTMTLASTAGNGSSTADFAIGGSIADAAANSTYGYYNLSGGQLNANSLTMRMGGNSGTTGYSVADIMGGTLNITNAIRITRGGNGGYFDRSEMNVSGGTVTATQLITGDGNSTAFSMLNIGGGGGAASVATTASATVGTEISDSGNNSGTCQSIVNLLVNGTLQTGIITANQAKVVSFNFNGGTLKATSPNAGTTFMTAANGTVMVYSGNGTVDNNGTAITIGKTFGTPAGIGLTGGTLANGSGYIGTPFVQITGGTVTGNNVATAIAIMADDGTGNGTYKVNSILITSPGVYSVAPTTATLSGGGPVSAATFTSLTTAANSTTGGMTFQGSGTNTLTAANTYVGNTTIVGGTLALSGSGSLASANIIVNSSTIFDVSAISYTMASGQRLLGTGNVNGSVTTPSVSQITPATNGVVGTLTFNNNLNESAGGTNRFYLSASGTSGNSKIVVTGNLTLSSSDTIIIDPITASTLDAANDYVLFQVSGTTTMSSIPALVWGTSTPANPTKYTIVQSGQNVVLHYAGVPVVTPVLFTPASPVYVGTSVSAGASASGGTPGYTYQWQAGPDSATWTNIPSATTTTYTPDTSVAGTNYYRLIATDTASAAATNVGAQLVVMPPSAPIITGLTITPSAVNWGTNANISMTASYGGTPPMISYQWQHSADNITFTNLPGATSSNLNFVNYDVQPADGGYYRVQAVNSVGTTTSSSATLTVNTASIVMLDIGASAPTAGTYDISQFSITGDVGGPAGLNYFVDTGNPGQTFTTGSNYKGYTLNEVFLQYGGQAGGGTPSSYTLCLYSISGSTATLIGQGAYTNNNTTPTVFTLGDWIRFGGNITNNLNPNTTYAYMFSRNGGGWWHPYVASGNPYANGEICSVARTGGAVTLGSTHVYDATFLTRLSAIPNPLTITTNPVSASVSLGGSTNFTVAALSDGTLSYQWYVVTAGPVTNVVSDGTDGDGTVYSGAATATLGLANTVLTDNGENYYCAVTSTYGGGITSNSAAATLTVLAVPVVGTTAFSPVSPVYAGTVDTLSATVTGGTPGYTYQWQGGTDSITFTNISNATNATYALDTTGMGGTTTYYRLVATDTASQVGYGTGAALVVNAASVPIITGPVITPSNILVGGSASMTATYNGTLPMTSFQWQYSPDNTLWANIPSATASSYGISGAVATQTGYYRVIAGNSVGSTTSGSAYLGVASYLINPTTLNGSFETYSGANTFVSGTVTNWVDWAGVSTATGGGTTANENGHTPSQGAREAFLPYNEAIYNLTAKTVQAGDVYNYTWDYLVGYGGGGVNVNVELGYWNGTAFVGITNSQTQGIGTAQQLGLGTSWTVTNGDPSIGHQIGLGIINPNANYPAVDNFVLTLVRAVNTLTITTNPVAATVNLNDGTNFSVSASTDGTIAGYQWYVITAGPVTNAVSNGTSGSGTAYSGATTATLGLSSAKGADNGNQYYCAVTSSYGNTVNSAAATLTVLINPIVGTTAYSPASPVYAGTIDTLSAPVTGGLPGYTYKWQSSADNFVTTTNNISNATNATYALDTTGMGGTTTYYRLVATDSNTNSGSGTGAALVVNAPSVPIITGPVITPSTINAGGSATMTANYNGTLPMTSFQWQHSVDNTVWVNVAGATASSYNLTGATPGQAGLYRVIAGNSVGSTTSGAAVLSVAQYLIYTNILNGSFESGSTATFASGNVPNWVDWAGVSTATGGGSVASVNGHLPSQGSRGAVLPYNEAVDDVTAHTIQAGEVYTYTWDYLVGFGGRANVELGYLSNGVFVAISSTLTTAVTTQQLGVGTTWTVPPGDPSIGYPIGVGIVNPNSNYPMVDNFALTLIPLPNPLTITGPTPTTAHVPVGGSTTLSVSATSDATITGYQWYVGTPGSGTALTNGADANGTVLGGVATPTLGFSSAAIADNGNTYYCAVTSTYNAGTTSNSAAATLNVVPILYWLASPADMNWNQTSLNWTGSVAYNDPDFVVFDSTGSGGTINIPGTVLPGAVAVNSGTYTFSGSGKISGVTALSVAGIGNLTVSAANDYTGGTTLSGGQLNIGGSGVLGTGALSISGGTLDNSSGAAMTLSPSLAETWNGSFTYAGSANSLNLGSGSVALGTNVQVTVSANTLTVPGTISDGGSNYGLTLAGSGTLVLSNYDTYTGNTTVSGGTLVLTKGGGTGTILNNLNIKSGALVQLAVGDALGYNVGGCVTNVNIVGGTLDATAATGNEGFRTSYKLTGGTMSSSGGTAAYNLDGASGVVVSSLATNVVSTISGNVVLRSSGVIFNVAQGTVSGGIDMVISGTVSGTGDTFTKSGSGTLLLSGHNSFTGGTTVNAGTMIVGNEWAAGLYGGAITNNGTLIINNNSIFNQVLTGVISGTGSLVQNGSEPLEISAANTYTGNTTVDGGVGGTLQIDQATLASASTVIVTNGGGGNLILNFSVTNPVAYLVLNGVSQPAGVYNGGNSSGLITGAGSLQVLIGASAFSSNAQLTSLALTPAGTLYPTFATNVYGYNATNTYANKTVTVAAAGANTNATLALNFNGGGYGAAVTNSLSIGGNTLVLPTNTVAVRVVSQDLSQTNVYTVNVVLQPNTSSPPVLVNSVSGGLLSLNWGADRLGYRLLVQTNNLANGVSGNIADWMTVPGSDSITATNITIITAGVTNAYYQLVYP